MTTEQARAAVLSLSLRHGLELVDALAELLATHNDPVAAAVDLIELRQVTVDAVTQVFDHLQQPRRRAQ